MLDAAVRGIGKERFRAEGGGRVFESRGAPI